MSFLLSPSILSADFNNLGRDIQMLNDSQADWIHIDVMDGVFVPNISFGFPLLEAVKKLASKPLDVHLMITKPERYIQQFAAAGANILTIHFEACMHLNRAIHEVKNNGMKVGIAINPHTPVSCLEEVISDIDMILVMSVNPGFAGQKFISNTYKKLNKLRELILLKNSDCLIEVDGGVNLDNSSDLVQNGANILVAGNAIFNTLDPLLTIRKFKDFSQ